MKKPVLKHQLERRMRFFLKASCGALLLPHEEKLRIAHQWPDATCKNCLRRKPKVKRWP